MMKRHDDDEKHENSERWLLTYADMITLLLVLFIVMFTMSSLDLQKFKEMASNLGSAFNGNGSGSGPGPGGGPGPGPSATGTTPSAPHSASPSTALPSSSHPIITPVPQNSNFEKIYELIKDDLKNNGLDGNIDIQKGKNYILMSFRDSVLFYPDSSKMKNDGDAILQKICQVLKTVNTLIAHIQIDGHTAEAGPSHNNDMFAWQLSSDRAIEVLRYMSQKGGLPMSKMSVAGYSHYVPVAPNNTEEGRAKNRRVEIKITQINDD